jgi:hypothetical protein
MRSSVFDVERGGIRAALAAALLAAVMVQTSWGAGAGQCEHAFILTTDFYTTAYYCAVEIPSPHTATINIGPVSTDAVAYYDWAEDKIFIVNRFMADNVQVVENGPDFRTIGQYSVGNGSNPHDIRLAGATKAYVTRYEWRTLLIIDPYSGDSLGVIDLSPMADVDGIPEMDRMEIVGDRLFVTLNNIDRLTWSPAGPGKVAVIDVAADTLVDCDPLLPGTQPIVLGLADPYTELRYDQARKELYVGCVGRWGMVDGGVEAIDPEGLTSKGVLVSEGAFGGDVSDVVLAPGGGGYAVILDAAPWPHNFARLVRFDDASGAVTDTLLCQTSGSGSLLAGIELNRQMELYLCDRDLTHPGLRIYETGTDTQIDFVDVGLPPFDICFVQAPYDSLPSDPSGPGAGGALSVHPNPFTGKTTISLKPRRGESGRASLAIFDACGRRVRTMNLTPLVSGGSSVDWDGVDYAGRRVSPGVYFCRPEEGSKAETRKIILVE